MVCLLLLPLSANAEDWTKLEDCQLVEHRGNDGDSFHVKHMKKEYLFRLYFVDCPETDDRFEERLKEQGRIWNLDKKGVLRAGRDASAFTERILSKPFTVYTTWWDARGASRMKRYFAFVVCDSGEYLSEKLVSAGYAHTYGASIQRPDGRSRDRVFSKLRQLEKQARSDGVGIWAGPQGGEKVASPERRSVGSGSHHAESEFEPYTLTCTSRVALLSIKNPGAIVGHLKPGAQVTLLTPPHLGKVRVRFATRDGSRYEAYARVSELGL